MNNFHQKMSSHLSQSGAADQSDGQTSSQIGKKHDLDSKIQAASSSYMKPFKTFTVAEGS